jgi:hypothetical protein
LARSHHHPLQQPLFDAARVTGENETALSSLKCMYSATFTRPDWKNKCVYALRLDYALWIRSLQLCSILHFGSSPHELIRIVWSLHELSYSCCKSGWLWRMKPAHGRVILHELHVTCRRPWAASQTWEPRVKVQQ